MEKGIIRVQVERTESRKEMVVIAEAMGIHPTPQSPNMDSGAGRTGMEVSWCEHIFSGKGVRDGTRWGDEAE